MTANIISGDRVIKPDDLQQRGRRAATVLHDLGVEPGDSLAVLLRNDPVFFEVSEAALYLGATIVPINWHFKPDEAHYILRDCEAKLLVAHSDLKSVLGQWPDWLPVLLCDPSPEIQEAYSSTNAIDDPCTLSQSWEQSLKAARPWPGKKMPARMGMIYTSGTTGKPKGVQRAPVDSVLRAKMGKLMGAALGLVPGDKIRTVITGPIYHAAPNTYATVAQQIGELVVLQPRFDAEGLLQLIQQHRITHVHLVPTMFTRLLQLPARTRAKYDISSLRFVAHGAAPCPPAVKRAMIEWWGPVIHEYYGGTETGGVVCHDSQEALRKPGTVGRAIEGCSIRIVDSAGNVLPVNQAGEIYIRNSNFPTFDYRGRSADRDAITDDDGYVTIGDIGYLDEEGYLFLCDRTRDMIISGGVNIYPAEIEATLHEIPEISDCAVFGIPDAEFGEKVCAVIELMPNSSLSDDQVKSFVRKRLSNFKVPREVVFQSDLPREDSGKIFKRQLRAPYWQGMGRNI